MLAATMHQSPTGGYPTICIIMDRREADGIKKNKKIKKTNPYGLLGKSRVTPQLSDHSAGFLRIFGSAMWYKIAFTSEET